MEKAVVCKNLKKTYGSQDIAVPALRGVDMEVLQGEFLMLMGPSGSGKTTLISIIAGILTQTEGECIVAGLNLNKMPDKEKTYYRGHHIGFVFQAFNLIPMLTVAENVSIPLLLLGCDRQEALNRARAILSAVGIGEKAGVLPKQLSGGQQQRVAIARAMIHNPDLIVCDEPTSFLDFDTGHKVMELLRAIVTENKKTLIVVSHDPRITKFADRIVRLEDGQIVEMTTPID